MFRSPPSPFQWHGSWLSTFLGAPKQALSRICCKNLFSDTLHRPFFCAQTSLLPYTSNIPPANDIPRLSDLGLKSFTEEWADKPFILTHPVRSWPAYKDWTEGYLLQKYGDIEFRAEAVEWPLQSYIDYMRDNSDESPLYLFDYSFMEKMGLKGGNRSGSPYSIPACFQEDLFDVLGDQRPDRRWLIIGPARSGSSFHKDPNATRLVSSQGEVFRGPLIMFEVPGTLFFVGQNTG